jgi:hypothetical protein
VLPDAPTTTPPSALPLVAVEVGAEVAEPLSPVEDQPFVVVFELPE